MKRIKMTLLIAFMMMTGVSVGQTEQIRRDAALYMADSLKLDSMYNYWNKFTMEHPKDEVAWRNLFEICSNQEFRLRCKNWEAGVQHF